MSRKRKGEIFEEEDCDEQMEEEFSAAVYRRDAVNKSGQQFSLRLIGEMWLVGERG